MAYIDKIGAVEGCTVYKHGRLVARDATFTLPEITFLVAEIKAMGTMEVPLPLIEAMEASMTRAAADADTAALGAPGADDLEVRWVAPKTKADGTVAEVGCKAFLRVMAKKVPSISIETGTLSEAEHTWAVSRYRLVIDGSEKLLVDRLADQLKINGTDYTQKLRSML